MTYALDSLKHLPFDDLYAVGRCCPAFLSHLSSPVLYAPLQPLILCRRAMHVAGEVSLS